MGDDTLTYTGEAWLGGAVRSITCSVHQGSYFIRLDELGAFVVNTTSREIHQTEEGIPNLPEHVISEVLTGPLLVLALTADDIWCLHASAVNSTAGVIAIMGDSGAGKSTLARHVATYAPEGYSLVADDVMPISSDGQYHVRPHFPQLKLLPHKQPGKKHPERLPFRAILSLEHVDNHHSDIHADLLTASDATKEVVRHTIASRLFSRSTLEAHWNFVTAMATHVPVYRMRYPHSPGSLQAALDVIDEIIS